MAWPWLSAGGRCHWLVAFHHTAREGLVAARLCLQVGSRQWVDVAAGTAAAGAEDWAECGRKPSDLVHPSNRSAHDVGAARVRVVSRSWFATHCTGVIVVKITTVGVTVVPILPTFVGSGWMKCLLLAAINTAKTHGWLLWETMAIALIATIPLFMIGEHALLLSGGVAAACGLLANSHAELLSVCKLVLHCNQAVSLALHGFLHSSIHGTKVCKGVTLQHNQRVVLHSGHTLSMLRGHDSSLVDECNHVGQIFFEGVDCLNHWWDRVLT